MKKKKKIRQKLLTFLNAYHPKTQLIKIQNSLDSSRPYGRLLENQKTGDLRSYFYLKMIVNLAPQKKFQKKHPDFRGLETNQRHEILTRIFLHMPFYI